MMLGMVKVVHIIPYNGIGGVEIAARSLPSGKHGNIHFGKLFIASRAAPDAPDERAIWSGPHASENALTNYIAGVRNIRETRPDLVVVSLWRSCILALLAKMVMPRLRLVSFLHLPEAVHLPDRVLNALVMRLSTAIWCDSATTLAARVPARLRDRARVISFLTERIERRAPSLPGPHFLFWGRLHSQKGLDTALRVFARIHARFPEASYTIIGPDMGARATLEALARELGVADAVHFTGPLPFEEIASRAGHASFYLQASLTEGMALSVVEAMQMGLIPAVRPVGEIARYARDGESAVFLGSDPRASADRIATLIDTPEAAAAMARAAHAEWANAALYRDEVLAACAALDPGDTPYSRPQG